MMKKSGETVLYSPRLDFELPSAADSDNKQNSKAPLIVNQPDVRTDYDSEDETEKPNHTNTDHYAVEIDTKKKYKLKMKKVTKVQIQKHNVLLKNHCP